MQNVYAGDTKECAMHLPQLSHFYHPPSTIIDIQTVYAGDTKVHAMQRRVHQKHHYGNSFCLSLFPPFLFGVPPHQFQRFHFFMLLLIAAGRRLLALLPRPSFGRGRRYLVTEKALTFPTDDSLGVPKHDKILIPVDFSGLAGGFAFTFVVGRASNGPASYSATHLLFNYYSFSRSET